MGQCRQHNHHAAVELSMLALLLVCGSISVPLVGTLRESVQRDAAVSRAELGLVVSVLGVLGSFVALGMGVLMRRTSRTTFVRMAMFMMLAGCGLMGVVRPAPGWPLLVIALGWLVMRTGYPLAAASNGIFADLWESSPQTGVLILHTCNSFGKALAPLIAIVVGGGLQPNVVAFCTALGVLAFGSLLWPRRSVRYLRQMEQSREVQRRLRLPADPVVWACAFQFAVITAAEAGATSVLGSLVATQRPCPLSWVPAERWPSVVMMAMMLGIVAGRVVFSLLSLRLNERQIIGACAACGLFAVPGAFVPHAVVYVPCLFGTGICFSATWPAFFGLAARAYPSERTFLSLGAGFFTSIGLWGATYVASAIGNVDERLPWAFVVSVAYIGLFVAFLFLTRTGRRLGRGRARAMATQEPGS